MARSVARLALLCGLFGALFLARPATAQDVAGGFQFSGACISMRCVNAGWTCVATENAHRAEMKRGR